MKIIMNECYDPEFSDVSTGTVFLSCGKVYIKTNLDTYNVVDLATGEANYFDPCSSVRVKVLDCELKINTKIEV